MTSDIQELPEIGEIVIATITNAQNVITGSGSGNLPSANYYYDYEV